MTDVSKSGEAKPPIENHKEKGDSKSVRQKPPLNIFSFLDSDDGFDGLPVLFELLSASKEGAATDAIQNTFREIPDMSTIDLGLLQRSKQRNVVNPDVKETQRVTQKLREILESLSLMAKCEKAFEAHRWKDVVRMSLWLFQDFLTNGKTSTKIFEKLSKKFPLGYAVSTYMREEDLIPVARMLLIGLDHLGMQAEAFSLCKDLVYGSAKYRGAKRAVPSNISSIMSASLLLYLGIRNDNYGEAVKLLLDHMSEQNSSPDLFEDAWILLDNLLSQNVNPSALRKSLEKTLELLQQRRGTAKTSVRLHLLLGNESFKVGKVDIAANHYSLALKSAPTNPLLLLNLARVYLEKFTTTAAANKNLLLTHGLLFLLRYRMFRRVSESQRGDVGIGKDPAETLVKFEVLYNFGIYFSRVGIYFMAEKYFREALNVEGVPSDTRFKASYCLAKLYRISGNKNLASAILKSNFSLRLTSI